MTARVPTHGLMGTTEPKYTTGEIQRILEELEHGQYTWVVYTKDKDNLEKIHVVPVLLSYIRTLEREHGEMQDTLLAVSSGEGCSLHQCGIWASKTLSSLTP